MKRSSVIVLIIFLCVIGVAAYFIFSKKSDTAMAWRTAVVERGDIVTLVTATGSLSAVTTVQVGTQVSGTIARLLVDFNSIVRKGQVIAILDTTFLVASRDDAAANVDKARAQFDQYTREFERAKKLFNEQVDTQVDYDQAFANLEMSKSNLKSAEAQLNRAKINLQYATIKAPIRGTVISRNVDVGQTVIASFNTPTLFTIANDLTKMEVQANIDEADIGQVSVGQSVEFTVDAYPDEIFKGTVKQIRLQPVMVQNVVNYIVIIDVPNANLKLMPGLTANINVNVQERRDVLKVPISALHFTPPHEYLHDSNNIKDSLRRSASEMVLSSQQSSGVMSHDKTAMIWLLEDGKLLPENVQTGISDGTLIEIQGPVKKGDVVVTGINHDASISPTAQNPFMPKMPTRNRNR